MVAVSDGFTDLSDEFTLVAQVAVEAAIPGDAGLAANPAGR